MELWTFSRSIKNIQTTTKEWYPQALQTKQNVHIILQQLGPPFPRGEKRGKMKLSTFQANHLVLHFIDMPLFVGPSGFHSLEICYDMLVWPRHSLELGAPFFRCSTSSPPPGPLGNGDTHPFYLIHTGMPCLPPMAGNGWFHIYIYIYIIYIYIYG